MRCFKVVACFLFLYSFLCVYSFIMDKSQIRSSRRFGKRSSSIVRTIDGIPFTSKSKQFRQSQGLAETSSVQIAGIRKSGGSKLSSVGLMDQGKPSSRPEIANANRLKIVGGTAKGRKIESPDVYLRPMMAKVREALFSSLKSMRIFEGGNCRVLDVFSGSGSVGLEALSRGANHATFVDFSAECCATALRNAENLGFSEQASAVTVSALDVLRYPAQYNLHGRYDMISLTPPYQEIDYNELLQAVWECPLVAPDTIVAFEYPSELPKLSYVLGQDKLFGLRSRRYGRTILAIYVYRPTMHLDMRPDEFA